MSSDGRARRLAVRVDSLLDSERTLTYPLIIVGIFWVTWTVGVALGTVTFLPDFAARWTAGRLVITGQTADLYDPTVQFALQHAAFGAEHLSWFVSPPFVALLFVPLAFLPYHVAGMLWLGASVVTLFFALRAIRPLVQVSDAWWLRFVAITFASMPAIELLGGGQDSAFILAALLFGFRAISSGREITGGALCGIALVKPHFAFLLPVLFIVHRTWRAFASMFVVGCGALTASVLLVGWTGLGQFLSLPFSELYTSEVQHGQAWKGVSFQALATGLAQPIFSGTHAIAVIASVGVAVWIAIRSRQWRADPHWGLAVLLLTLVVTSPHAMLYDAIIAAPALAIIMSRRSTRYDRLLLATMFVLFFIGPGLHSLTSNLPWPGSIIGLTWATIPLAIFWWRALLYHVNIERES